MNARQAIWLTLSIGALTLLLSSTLMTFASIKVWNLRQQISASSTAQQGQSIDNANAQNYLVRATSHGAAGADLLTRLRTSARQAGVSLTRAEPRPADPADPQSVKISAQASGSSRAIAAFLYEIEALPPALVIQRARLSTDGSKTMAVDILVTARAQYPENIQ